MHSGRAIRWLVKPRKTLDVKAARLHPEAIAAGGTQKSSGVEQPAERSDIEAFLDENSGSLKAFIEANEAIMDGMATLSAV